MTVGITLAGGGSVLAWQTAGGIFFERFDGNLDPLGAATEVASGRASWVSAEPLANGGFAIVWDARASAQPMAQDYDSNGAAVGASHALGASSPSADFASTSRDVPTGPAAGPWTTLLPNGDTVVVTASNGGSNGPPSLSMQQYVPAGNPIGPAYVHGIPGLPGLGHVETAALANGGYVVSFVDESNYGAASFVDLFAADGTHLRSVEVTTTGFQLIGSQEVAALADGGFVVSWTAAANSSGTISNPAPYAIFSQEFDVNGNAAGSAHTVAMLPDSNYTQPQIAAFPNGSYTISWTSDGAPQSASFTEQGAAIAGDTNDAILTPALAYTLPVGPHDVTLVGSTAQTVTGNDLGDTIVSNDYGSTLIGGTGNDTLIAGHGADVMTGGGGHDTFVYNALPANAGSITDFNTASDKLDLSGIFASIGYSGSNPVGDGYLQFVSDGTGDTRVYVDPQGPGTRTPILVTTLDHVSPASITPADYGYPASAGAYPGGGGSRGHGSGRGKGETLSGIHAGSVDPHGAGAHGPMPGVLDHVAHTALHMGDYLFA